MDFVDNIGRSYLERKANQAPAQIEDAVKKQFSKGKGGDNVKASGTNPKGAATDNDAEVADLRRKLAKYEMAEDGPMEATGKRSTRDSVAQKRLVEAEKSKSMSYKEQHMEQSDGDYEDPPIGRRSDNRESEPKARRQSTAQADRSRARSTSRPALRARKSRMELLDARVEKGGISTKSRRKLKEERKSPRKSQSQSRGRRAVDELDGRIEKGKISTRSRKQSLARQSKQTEAEEEEDTPQMTRYPRDRGKRETQAPSVVSVSDSHRSTHKKVVPDGVVTTERHNHESLHIQKVLDPEVADEEPSGRTKSNALRAHMRRENELRGMEKFDTAASIAPSDSISVASRPKYRQSRALRLEDDEMAVQETRIRKAPLPKYELVPASNRIERSRSKSRHRPQRNKDLEPVILMAEPRDQRPRVADRRNDRASIPMILAPLPQPEPRRKQVRHARVAMQQPEYRLRAASPLSVSSSSSSTETIRRTPSIFSKAPSYRSTSPSSLESYRHDRRQSNDPYHSHQEHRHYHHTRHHAHHQPARPPASTASTVSSDCSSSSNLTADVYDTYYEKPHPSRHRRASSLVSNTSSSIHGGSAALLHQRERYDQLSHIGAVPKIPPIETRRECKGPGFHPRRRLSHADSENYDDEIIEVFEDKSTIVSDDIQAVHAPSCRMQQPISKHAEVIGQRAGRTLYQVR